MAFLAIFLCEITQNGVAIFAKNLLNERLFTSFWGKVLKFRGLLPIGSPPATVFMEPGIDHEEDEADNTDDDEEEDARAGVP
jgi:hypothetical protein